MQKKAIAIIAILALGTLLLYSQADVKRNLVGYGGINRPTQPVPRPDFAVGEQPLVGYGGINRPTTPYPRPDFAIGEGPMVGYGGINRPTQPVPRPDFVVGDEPIVGYGGINRPGYPIPRPDASAEEMYPYLSQEYTYYLLSGIANFYDANAWIEQVVMTESLGFSSPNLEAYGNALTKFGDAEVAFTRCAALAEKLKTLDSEGEDYYEAQIADCGKMASLARDLQSTMIASFEAVKAMRWQSSIWSPPLPEAKITELNIAMIKTINRVMERHSSTVSDSLGYI